MQMWADSKLIMNCSVVFQSRLSKGGVDSKIAACKMKKMGLEVVDIFPIYLLLYENTHIDTKMTLWKNMCVSVYVCMYW